MPIYCVTVKRNILQICTSIWQINKNNIIETTSIQFFYKKNNKKEEVKVMAVLSLKFEDIESGKYHNFVDPNIIQFITNYKINFKNTIFIVGRIAIDFKTPKLWFFHLMHDSLMHENWNLTLASPKYSGSLLTISNYVCLQVPKWIWYYPYQI